MDATINCIDDDQEDNVVLTGRLGHLIDSTLTPLKAHEEGQQGVDGGCASALSVNPRRPHADPGIVTRPR